MTFIANPLGKPEVNHLSAEKTDNSVMNLDWATKRENAAHAAGMGLILHGEQVHTAKLTSERVAQIHTEIAGVKGHKRADKVRELAARFGVSCSTIRSVASGRSWKHCLPKERHEASKTTVGQREPSGAVGGQVGAPIVFLGAGQIAEAISAQECRFRAAELNC